MVRLIASQVASAAKAIADKPDISALPLQEAGWLSCVSGDGNGIGLPATARAFPPALCRWGVVRDLQRGGFDVQMTGFGLMSTYHADNEYCLLSDMKAGFEVLREVVSELEA